ncbi:hypothetical protein T4C_11639 [Trichinella pseudospiralis]|uniref:Uncharacterized protein n=1 Tax=Trichinella pseudospiralis TaxID=6337 RepID=A0A0V1GET8_TRIPS|nr:hypothetical protein T4C_11639 [Trichinella pseudospiralis]
MQTLPCSLGRYSARFPTLEQGKPRLSALKWWVRLRCFTYLRCAGSLVLFPCSQGRGDCAFCLLNRVRESAIFLALWAGGAHASRPWSGESLGFPR